MSSTLSRRLAVILASATLLAGCSTVAKVIPKRDANVATASVKSGGTKVRSTRVAPRLGVNSYLWRATLETLDFMPMAEVDPFGGVILTDWYANPKAPNERFKANVYILDTNLRADALSASIFKQVRSPSGWSDASVDADTGRQIENAILTRARQLYVATVDN